MRRTKIVYCIDNLDRHGAQIQLLELVKKIDRRSYDVSVCTGRDGPLKMELEALGIPVEVCGKEKWWHVLKVFVGFWKCFLKIKPEIVQGSLLYSNVLAAVVASVLRIPIIITVQHSIYRVDLSGWMQPLAWLAAILSDVTVTVFNGYVTPKPYTHVVHIPNGVDMAKFENCWNKRSRGSSAENLHKKIFAVGRLSSEKGHRYLIDAVGLVKKSHPEVELWIAGDGELRASLEKQVVEKKMTDCVKFLGNRKDIEELMAKVDVFVLPSLHEGFGLAAAEAMACGLPVVATEAVKVNQLIEDGTSGFVVPAKNSVAIAARLRRILDDESRSRAIGQSARNRIKSLFTSEKTAKRYMALYQRLMTVKGLTC